MNETLTELLRWLETSPLTRDIEIERHPTDCWSATQRGRMIVCEDSLHQMVARLRYMFS